MQIRISDTLGIETTGGESSPLGVRIIREGGGLVWVRLDEVKALVAALTEAGARIAADAAGDEFVETDDLW